MAKYYWNDDTQVLSLGGCPGHSEGDILAGEPIPEWYPEEYGKRFDKFCQDQQISSKKNVTFSEKQKAQLINAQSTVGKLRARIEEQTKEIKGLEKKVEDFEASISQIEVLEGHQDELERLKAEVLEMGKSYAALENEKSSLVDQHNESIRELGDEKAAADLKIEKLGDEKAELELDIEKLNDEKQYLIDAFEGLESEKAASEPEETEKSSKKTKKGDK